MLVWIKEETSTPLLHMLYFPLLLLGNEGTMQELPILVMGRAVALIDGKGIPSTSYIRDHMTCQMQDAPTSKGKSSSLSIN